uniref:PiggyBac transposable element-derived protein domain-containing protein n=1 Tax=Monopterus albus TaxID=43700 RepID=A0A3Q3QJ73_MONAL
FLLLLSDTCLGSISLSKAERLLNAIVGENSDVEELSDGEEADPGVELLHDKDYIPPDLSESDQQSSDSDSEPPPSTECARKRKRGRSVEPGSSKNTSRVRWKSSAFTPDIVQFEAEEETLHERHNWQPLDYMEQYIDRELMNLIANYLSFFGASIFMSCVSYPQLRMFWSSALRIPAISDKLKRDRFFKLRKHLKVVIDSDISEDMRKADKFWKTRPFIDRILKGCLLQARPECVSIDEQMIPFTGACPFRQYVPLKPNPVGMKNFVLATAGGIVLDFEVYQGANSLRSQIQDAEELGLGVLVIARLAKTLHPGTKVYCDRFFTSMKAVDQMLEKQVYLTGTIMKNRVTEPLQKLPSDQDMKEQGRGASASVTRGDGKVCVVKWYDNKAVLMLSTVHAEQPEDVCQRWSKKDKQYVSVMRPSIVREYNTKMGGVDLTDRMMSYYRMSVRTKKWTIRMLMHFLDLALANSWLLYRQDNTLCGTPKRDMMQFLQFRMTVNAHPLQQGSRHQITPVPHVSIRTTSTKHLPEMVNLKNPMRCRQTGCSGKSRVRCMTCNMFLCLQTERNCFAIFQSGPSDSPTGQDGV